MKKKEKESTLIIDKNLESFLYEYNLVLKQEKEDLITLEKIILKKDKKSGKNIIKDSFIVFEVEGIKYQEIDFEIFLSMLDDEIGEMESMLDDMEFQLEISYDEELEDKIESIKKGIIFLYEIKETIEENFQI